ncbi:arabinogalactan oligomer/maltooligosaccharide transport system permease protein [Kineothrix alysoides]|uniref:Maltose/maltodextrin transport system permease protein n=1 Tax=Kineothrix alysoides TaxID=1469948 RepID=A0A4R1QP41_9FIRM|nr:sugar ABC transporter permease [Kineothrix alysoides]TCL55478.1 arabinogalactan oligomer/maltooligosaccharide transport system permease protein [Kineothrix alysoides]
MKGKMEQAAGLLRDSGPNVKLSIVIMGGGQFKYGARGKGILFFLIQLSVLYYFITRGFADIAGFFTLGTKKGDAWLGVTGDNSVVMLLMGIFAWLVLAAFLYLYAMNIGDAYRMKKRLEQGRRILTLREEAMQLWDKKFYVTVLILPVAGVFVFNVLPIIFMILIAFTNYGGTVVPPELVDWVGAANFVKLLSLSQFAPTFVKILGWNLLWAVAATVLNYFAGLGLALLLDKDCVKGKAFWRMFPVLAYAIPGFITLLAFKFMFSYGGPVNQLITAGGGAAIGFLDLDAKWTARLIGIVVNCWISTPSIMLLATGILSNRDISLYEAARIDGAGKWKQFLRITMPFVLFSTLPVLIGQFVGNFNNFGIFYFLRGGLYMDGYFLASDTDLLINWLYNLSINNNYYCLGAAISLVIFVITSIISLTVYIKSPSYREEDTFR